MTEWKKSVYIAASRTNSGYVSFEITMGLTGPQLVMRLGDARIVIASRWQDYTTDHGGKQIVDAIEEGFQVLKNRVEQ